MGAVACTRRSPGGTQRGQQLFRGNGNIRQPSYHGVHSNPMCQKARFVDIVREHRITQSRGIGHEFRCLRGRAFAVGHPFTTRPQSEPGVLLTFR